MLRRICFVEGGGMCKGWGRYCGLDEMICSEPEGGLYVKREEWGGDTYYHITKHTILSECKA